MQSVQPTTAANGTAPPRTAGAGDDAGARRPQLLARPQDERWLAAQTARLPRPGRWLSAAVIAVLAAMFVNTVLTNPRFQWDVVGEYFLQDKILQGLWLTLWLTASVMVCGFVLGIGFAAMRLSANPLLRATSFGYVWLVRSVPPLVQLLFWFELASLYPTLSLGIPFGPEVLRFHTAHLMTGIVAAFIALTIDVAAYAAEIVRGGLLSVDRAQTEAAEALGLGRARIFRRIVLPQAMPAIVPASGNMLIGLLKATSIVSVIAVQDLLYTAQLTYQENFKIIPLLLVATIWYVIVTTVLSVGQYFIERHYSRGKRPSPDRTFGQVLRANAAFFPLASKGVRR